MTSGPSTDAESVAVVSGRSRRLNEGTRRREPSLEEDQVPGDRPRPTPSRVHGCGFSPSPCLTLACQVNDGRGPGAVVPPGRSVPRPARARPPHATQLSRHCRSTHVWRRPLRALCRISGRVRQLGIPDSPPTWSIRSESPCVRSRLRCRERTHSRSIAGAAAGDGHLPRCRRSA